MHGSSSSDRLVWAPCEAPTPTEIGAAMQKLLARAHKSAGCVRQTAAGHGRACPRAWLGWPRSTRQKSLASRGGSDQGWRRSPRQSECRRRRGGSRRRRAAATPRDNPGLRRLARAKRRQRPRSNHQTDGGQPIQRAQLAHDPDVGSMAAQRAAWIDRVFSNRRRAHGVCHGLRRKHLQSYLDEVVIRYNRRRTRNAAFRSLLSIGLITKPITYEMLKRQELRHKFRAIRESAAALRIFSFWL